MLNKTTPSSASATHATGNPYTRRRHGEERSKQRPSRSRIPSTRHARRRHTSGTPGALIEPSVPITVPGGIWSHESRPPSARETSPPRTGGWATTTLAAGRSSRRARVALIENGSGTVFVRSSKAFRRFPHTGRSAAHDAIEPERSRRRPTATPARPNLAVTSPLARNNEQRSAEREGDAGLIASRQSA